MEENNQLVIMQFGAEWCNPCIREREMLINEPIDGILYQFIDVNLEENDELVNKYHIVELPTIFIMNKRNDEYEILEKFIGFQTREKLIDSLKKFDK